ncbi:MAG: alanine racemase, partial [Nocardioides sp.]
MGLDLTVDGARWREHLRATAAATPGLVPVAKGNGYGFTLGRLARRAQWLDGQSASTGTPIDLLAVGTYDELGEVVDRYAGDLLVLTPWRSFQ